jgi:hypothetical protein
MEKGKRQKTILFKNLLSEHKANELYEHLLANTEWEDGPRSKKGFTRKALGIDIFQLYTLLRLFPVESHKTIWDLVKETVDENSIRSKCGGAYVNYYRNGEDWTPNHTHRGSSQFVLSLGQTRSLEVGKRRYELKSGDAILFGSAVHGVPKDDSKEGRISIALFLE